ncbi:MAG TPA: hypothetical protein VK864_04200, partial [Longimicrobiales bacterium]|nr:hypothetical protein [Longimicrobiales bacterium]
AMMRRLLIAGCLLGSLVAPARAQWRERAPVMQDTVRPSVARGFARVGKWATLTGAAGAAVYGYLANRDADSRYEDLETLCLADPERCADRLPDGSFADPTLEQEYQEILDLDSRARFSLTASQIAMAATIVLFIIDLPRGGTGEDIPYRPPRLQVGNAPGNRVTVTYRLSY